MQPAPSFGAVAAETAKEQQLAGRRAELRIEVATLARQREELRAEVIEMDDIRLLQEVGVYNYRHPLASAAAYKEQLAQLQAESRLGALLDISITDHYQWFRLREIELTGDYKQKQQEEKEAEQERRAELREAEKVAREIAVEEAKLVREAEHHQRALEALRASGGLPDDIAAIEAEIADLAGALEGLHQRSPTPRPGTSM